MHTRRTVVTAGGLLALEALAAPAFGDSLTVSDPRFGELEQQLGPGGRLGFYALDVGSGRTLAHRADERFALCSTFKLLLAAAVLRQVDTGELELSHEVRFGRADIVEPAPAALAALAAHADAKGAGAMTVEDLCAAVIVEGDNTAANLLMPLVMGAEGLTYFLRARGDAITRLDRPEPDLNANLPDDPRDTTTPAAIVATMRRLLLGDVLAPSSRQRLVDWMIACKTGTTRLRAGLPAGWRCGDKTGAGGNGAVNDIAIVYPPSGGPLLLACYLSGGTVDTDTRHAVHRKAAAIAAERLAA